MKIVKIITKQEDGSEIEQEIQLTDEREQDINIILGILNNQVGQGINYLKDNMEKDIKSSEFKIKSELETKIKELKNEISTPIEELDSFKLNSFFAIFCLVMFIISDKFSLTANWFGGSSILEWIVYLTGFYIFYFKELFRTFKFIMKRKFFSK